MSCSSMHNVLHMAPQEADAPDADAAGGRLELAFERAPSGKTFIHRQFASYPFHVCRALYLDGALPDMATVYTQSSSGGLYTQDRLVASAQAGVGAQVHLTTQASTIVHRSTHGPARQEVHLAAEAGAYVEYLPDPVILLPGAHLVSKVRVQAEPSASVVLFDAFLAHDPEGKGRMFDRMVSDVVIEDETGRPTAIDRFEARGSDFSSPSVGVTGGYACHGTIIAYSPGHAAERLLDASRRAAGDVGGASVGSSLLPGARGVWARVMASDGADLRSAMLELWKVMRLELTGAPASVRRK